MQTQYDELGRWIDDHEGEMVDFLSKYVSYRSITESEAGVQREFIEPFFDAEMEWDDVTVIDVSSEGDRPNINARLEGEGDGPNLLFNGHSDVVPAIPSRSPDNWRTDPWELTASDGALFGRGASDMKGPNTAMIWAIKAVMETSLVTAGDVLLSLVVGEERCQQDYGSIPATNAWLERGFHVPFCINAEPTNLEIHVESASLFNLEISVPGKAVHASQNNLIRHPQRPGAPQGREVGVDANELLIEVLERLYELEDRWNRKYADSFLAVDGKASANGVQGNGAVTLVPTIVDSGSHVASISNHARIEGQVYLPPSVDPDVIQSEFRDTLQSIETTHEWLADNPMEITFGNQLGEEREFSYWPSFEVAPDHPGAKTLGDAFERVTGNEPVHSRFKAVTDGGFIQKVCGVDTVSFGPGNTHMGVHGANEYLPVDQLLTAAKVYAAMIVEWCNAQTNGKQ